MKPNPGGILTGDAIVDREREILSIWEALHGRSVVLTSERRVGKTSILRKMMENPQDDWIPLLYWVEGIRHPIEFVEGLYDLIIEKGVLKGKFHKLKKFYFKFGGGDQIGNWKLPQIRENWKTLLESAIEDITTRGKKALLMFDELPLMLSHFIHHTNGGPNVGIEFMDTLRKIRNKFEPTQKIKFIFCGSIGIHLIIKDLKKNHGYNSDPINNMKIISLSGMDENGALTLCDYLSKDAPYRFDNQNKVFKYICERTDSLPFYIHHVFSYFEHSGARIIAADLVDEAIDYLLNDPRDQGFFNHYIDRIKTYYGEELKRPALFILDNACKHSRDWPEEDIINEINARDEIEDEIVKEALNLLWCDHYLKRSVRNFKRSYRFRYSILKNWWLVNRG